MMRPPAEALLRAMLAPRDRETIPGDLAEAYAEQVSARGRRRADLWYLRQVVSIVWHVAPRSPKRSSVSAGVALGLLMTVGIVVTNVVLPLLHCDLPENAFTNAVWLGAVFAAIGTAGWLARARGVRAAMKAGAVVSFTSFGMAMLTFMVVDNVFFDLIRQQPEKIWLFQHSGYDSMRVAITMAQVRALITVLPVLGLLGALVGGLGGVIAKVRFRR